jgi:osmotically-inducible protein OsmY
VRAVINRLEVEPQGKATSDLTRRIKELLLEASEEDFANVVVAAEGSRVRLTGAVPRAKAKSLAEHVTWYAAGVTAIDNQIRVRPTFVRDDDEIKSDIVSSLRDDPYVGGAP